MDSLKETSKDYFADLEKRSVKSKVHHSHQLIGLNLAEILHDQEHKSLYIKLAKNHNSDRLMQLAKTVAENHRVLNKGAYFMAVLAKEIKKSPPTIGSKNK